MRTARPGSFCTSVLRTRDVGRAAAFYRTLIGWSTQEVPGTTGHVLLQWRGLTVASLQQIGGGGDIWVPHVAVADVERTTAEALALGATLVDTTPGTGLARLASLRDPEGAVFGLWQPSPHEGAELTGEPGSLWWIEVLSNEVARARDFYGSLFRWTSVETSFEPFSAYMVFTRGEVQEGGILPIGRDWDVSPRWNSIFEVPDCDGTLQRAAALGGSPIFVHTVPKHGRIGILSDPGGAVFVLRGPVP